MAADQLQLVSEGSVPPRPSETHVLRGQCTGCAQWPLVDPATGLLKHHRYHKSDSQARRGRCHNAGQPPARMKWIIPLV